MTILLDHCVPRRYRRLLTEWGYAAVLMTDHLPSNAKDPEVLALAQRLDAILLSVDGDFGNVLDYPPQDYQGIIVLKYRIQHEFDIDQCLQSALTDLTRDDMRGKLITITNRHYRVRG